MGCGRAVLFHSGTTKKLFRSRGGARVMRGAYPCAAGDRVSRERRIVLTKPIFDGA
jgi:hypothetical protein